MREHGQEELLSVKAKVAVCLLSSFTDTFTCATEQYSGPPSALCQHCVSVVSALLDRVVLYSVADTDVPWLWMSLCSCWTVTVLC